MKTEMNGITGKILRVDLTAETAYTVPTPVEAMHKFLGGRGLGAHFLWEEVDPGSDPHGPENMLIFMTGPLTGTLMPGSNKVNVTFKSPLTGTYSYSLCGGHWGPELKFAGYDGLIIEGQSKDPVYLWIDDDSVEIRPAEFLWGKPIPETESLIKKDVGGDAQVHAAVIGPAGENLNRMACITADWHREFGRGGCGAVMGSKKLKGIALRGTGSIKVSDPEGLMAHAQKLYGYLEEHPKLRDRRNYGTAELMEGINGNGMLATRNFTGNYFQDAWRLAGPKMREDIVVGDASCYGCPVACGKRSLVRSEKYGEVLVEGPEFETIGLLGSNCGVSDWDALLKATWICDSTGMDTMNAGGCVALAMECYEKGIINREDTGGIDLRFGNGEALVAVLQMMATREGIGNILADGIKPAAEHFGVPQLGMHSKGQGLAVYDPRGVKGMALTYATSPKGAHHMVATTFGGEIAAGNRLSIEGKGDLQRTHQFSMAIVDSLLLCSTMRPGIGLKDMALGYTLVTGLPMTDDELQLTAERVVNLERMYNVRMGYSRSQDTLPSRILKEGTTDGPSQGSTVDLDRMLDEFYRIMGWDENGVPTREKLDELGLLEE